jgi:hypothetical protein
MASKDQQIAEDFIARSVDLFRFTAAERSKVLKILKTVEDELTYLLTYSGKNLSDITRADKARILRQARALIEEHYATAGEAFDASLAGVASVESKATAKAFGNAFQGQIEPALPTEVVLRKLVDGTLVQGHTVGAWFDRQEGDLAFRFQLELQQGIAQAETNAQIIKRVRDNVMPVARNNVAALVQTSVQTVSAAARRETVKANSDIIKGIRQISTLDGHTTPICIAYAGAEWDLNYKPIGDNKLPYNGGVPRHWNCRSIEVPITRTFKELGIDLPEPPASTRAAHGGQVRGNITFDEFLRSKPKAFVDDLLGPGRAELWRDKTITLQQLLDQHGRPLTLEELRSRHGV